MLAAEEVAKTKFPGDCAKHCAYFTRSTHAFLFHDCFTQPNSSPRHPMPSILLMTNLPPSFPTEKSSSTQRSKSSSPTGKRKTQNTKPSGRAVERNTRCLGPERVYGRQCRIWQWDARGNTGNLSGDAVFGSSPREGARSSHANPRAYVRD